MSIENLAWKMALLALVPESMAVAILVLEEAAVAPEVAAVAMVVEEAIYIGDVLVACILELGEFLDLLSKLCNLDPLSSHQLLSVCVCKESLYGHQEFQRTARQSPVISRPSRRTIVE